MAKADVRGGRVALFTGSMRGGGAERAMLILASAFCDRGVGVGLVLVKAEGEYLDMVPDGVRVIVPMPSRGAYQGEDYALAILSRCPRPRPALPS